MYIKCSCAHSWEKQLRLCLFLYLSVCSLSVSVAQLTFFLLYLYTCVTDVMSFPTLHLQCTDVYTSWVFLLLHLSVCEPQSLSKLLCLCCTTYFLPFVHVHMCDRCNVFSCSPTLHLQCMELYTHLYVHVLLDTTVDCLPIM